MSRLNNYIMLCNVVDFCIDSIAMDTTNKDGGKFYIAVQMGSVRHSNEKNKVNKVSNTLWSVELWWMILLCFCRVFLAWKTLITASSWSTARFNRNVMSHIFISNCDYTDALSYLWYTYIFLTQIHNTDWNHWHWFVVKPVSETL